jgi:hypothetical protein
MEELRVWQIIFVDSDDSRKDGPGIEWSPNRRIKPAQARQIETDLA